MLRVKDQSILSRFVARYFATQALYDMLRQWISNRGPFRFNYRWKAQLSRHEMESIAGQFEKSMGISHQQIPVR
jgi:hypothetical protein